VSRFSGVGARLGLARVATAQAQLGYALAQRDAAVAFIAVYKSFGGALPPLQMQ
jgi:hypothetical protein